MGARITLVPCVCFGSIVFAHQADVCRDAIEAARQRDLGAEAALARCAQSDGAPLEVFLMLAGIYQAKKDPAALQRIANEAIERFPSEQRFYLTAAALAGRNQQFDDAIRVLTEAAKLWPSDSKIRELLANSYFGRGSERLNKGQSMSAVADLEHATELAPADVEAWMNLGRAQHNLARYTEALAAFNQVYELQPRFPLVHFHRGMSYHALGDFDRSIAELDAQIQVDAAYSPAYLIRGLAHLAKAQDEAAAADLERAARTMPESSAAQYAYARALVRLGELNAAEERLRSAIKLDPEDPAPVNTLVTVLTRLDRPDEARVLKKKASELAARRRSAAPGEIRFERGAVQK